MDYLNLGYGAQMHFATAATNNGHDGDSEDGTAFQNAPETIVDFAWRAIQTTAEAGKRAARSFYGSTPHHSYYAGCSTGGRQGFRMAQDFPTLFDGILAAAPAVDVNILLGWGAVVTGAVRDLAMPWEAIHSEIMRQCDQLDGKLDGIIDDPDATKEA